MYCRLCWVNYSRHSNELRKECKLTYYSIVWRLN